MNAPAWDRPGRLWSLWEMIEFRFKPLLAAQDMLVQLSVLMHSNDKRVCPHLPEVNKEDIRNQMNGLRPHLASEEFALCRRGVDRVLATLERTDRTIEIVSELDDLRRRLLDQSENASCLLLSWKDRELYSPPAPLFNSEFEQKFPSALFELDEAGKCLALNRPTAAVFHLMRLLEIGIRAIARSLQIPDPLKPQERNWAIVLKAIKVGIDERWPSQAARYEGDGALFEQLYASLDAVRNPWRNATMHVEQKYLPEEAEHIFIAVRGLMKKLASRMDEQGQPLA